MAPNIPHQIKQAHPNLPPHMQAMIAAQQGHPQQGPQGPTPSAPYVPRPPKPKYIRRTLRALIFGFIAYAFLYTAVISYERGHIKGYTPLLQWSPGHYSNPLPMVIIGLCFGLLTVLQAAKIIKVARLRRQYG